MKLLRQFSDRTSRNYVGYTPKGTIPVLTTEQFVFSSMSRVTHGIMLKLLKIFKINKINATNF